MRTSLLVVPVAALSLASGCCHQNAASPAAEGRGRTEAAAPAQQGRVVPGEYIFVVTPGTSAASLQSSLSDLAPRRVQDLGENQFLVVFRDDPGLSRLSFRIGNGQILSVQPNFVYKATR